VVVNGGEKWVPVGDVRTVCALDHLP